LDEAGSGHGLRRKGSSLARSRHVSRFAPDRTAIRRSGQAFATGGRASILERPLTPPPMGQSADSTIWLGNRRSNFLLLYPDREGLKTVAGTTSRHQMLGRELSNNCDGRHCRVKLISRGVVGAGSTPNPTKGGAFHRAKMGVRRLPKREFFTRLRIGFCCDER